MKKTHLVGENRLFCAFVFLLCLGWAAAAAGHSLFIQSSRYYVHEGKSSPLFFCYGHHIPVDDGIRPDKLKTVSVHSPSGKISPIALRDETCLHSYMVDYTEKGTYVLTAVTNPGYYTVYIDKKGRERHTIKPKNQIMENADKILKSLHSSQYTKTYVVCTSPSEIFPAQVGLPLELVPDKDISSLKAGEILALTVYFKGKPYTGQGTWDATVSGFSTEAENNFYEKTRVKGASVRIPIPEPGRWFVRYFIKTHAAGEDQKLCNQMKQTASLVFEIKKQGTPVKAGMLQ